MASNTLKKCVGIPLLGADMNENFAFVKFVFKLWGIGDALCPPSPWRREYGYTAIILDTSGSFADHRNCMRCGQDGAPDRWTVLIIGGSRSRMPTVYQRDSRSASLMNPNGRTHSQRVAFDDTRMRRAFDASCMT
uniref:Uncharacterized protein n=1 Tax=Craspedostauros australis TaxID=1486917 RepID=A0A7R9ZKX5_9STRA